MSSLRTGQRSKAVWLLLLVATVLQHQSASKLMAQARQHTPPTQPFYRYNLLESSLPSAPSCPKLNTPASTTLLYTLRGGSDYYKSSQQPPPYKNQNSRYREEWEIPREEEGADRYHPEQHDQDYYDDRGLPSPSMSNRRSNSGGRLANSMNIPIPNIVSKGNRKVGLPLLAAGVAVTMLGMSLFFNKTLMRLGNLLFISGVVLTLGPSRTMGYFLQPQKARATACLAAGIFLVFIGWPIVGIALELFGLLNLFGNMFPVFWLVVKQMPIVGNLLQQTGGDRGGKQRAYKSKYYDDDDDFVRRKREEEELY